MSDQKIAELTAGIVTNYVSANQLPPEALPDLIKSIYASIARIDAGQPTEPAKVPLQPAVSIKRSITPEAITCLECGKAQKSLKRHLMSAHDLSPDGYRSKWGLPKDYPMVSANYAAARSQLAKSMGLGQSGRTRATKPKVG